jgi:hypothetical protein
VLAGEQEDGEWASQRKYHGKRPIMIGGSYAKNFCFYAGRKDC